MTPESGPTLEQYVETRFNMFERSLNDKIAATDLRYQQRFEAQSDALAAAFLSQQTAMKTAFDVAEKAVNAALAAADRAVSKAELASDKRFESVNEFRKTLSDQQATFMPRSEANVALGAMAEKLSALKASVDQSVAERQGVKGGWGYAVGVVGFVLALGSLLILIMRIFGKG